MQEKKTFFPMSREFATKRNSLDNLLLLREPSSFSENSSHHAGPETARSCFYRRWSPSFCSPHTSCLGPGCMYPEFPGRAGCVSSLPSLITLLTWHEGAPDKFSFPFLIGLSAPDVRNQILSTHQQISAVTYFLGSPQIKAGRPTQLTHEREGS